MIRKWIDNLDNWLALKERLKSEGYTLWQTQYSWYEPQGLIVGFMKGEKQIEIVTHSKEVAEDIRESGL